MLESKEHTQSGRKGQRFSKLSPELKAEISMLAAEHGMAATVRLYAKKLHNCWAMGVVNLKLELEVGGASTVWRSSKIKLRKRLIRENFSPRKFLAIQYIVRTRVHKEYMIMTWHPAGAHNEKTFQMLETLPQSCLGVLLGVSYKDDSASHSALLWLVVSEGCLAGTL